MMLEIVPGISEKATPSVSHSRNECTNLLHRRTAWLVQPGMHKRERSVEKCDNELLIVRKCAAVRKTIAAQ